MATPCLVTATVFAQPARTVPVERGQNSDVPVRKTSDAGSYEYLFDDEVLDANPNVTRSMLITVRSRAPRAGLIRPRVQFVPEMLKSVEGL